MMKTRAVIIDDEKHNIENLYSLLALHCSNVEVQAIAMNVDEGLTAIAEVNPDLLFLDIQMPGKNGFDLLRALPNRDVEVVFVTAYDHYGIQAIKFSAIDYLLKPLAVPELKLAVEKVAQRLESKRRNIQLENLLDIIEKRVEKPDRRIALPSLRETRLVLVVDIVRCESSNNYTNFFLQSKDELLVSKPIYEYEELLAGYGFVRCHQSHLVNRKHVLSFLKEDGGYLLLTGGFKVPVSRQRKEEVKRMLGF